MRRFVFAASLGLTACDSAPTHGPVSFVTYDSAGVQVSVTLGSSVEDLNWSVDSIPDLIIGEGGPSGDVLYRVQGARLLQNGIILVVDGGSRELRFYDHSGVLLSRVGGEGDGPGEFRDPVLVPLAGRPDTLLVFDKVSRRLQGFTLDGQHDGTTPTVFGWPAGRRAPVGVLDSQAVLFERREIFGGEASLAASGLRRLTYEYFWHNPATSAAIVLDTVVVDWSYRSRTDESPVPFSSRPCAAVGVTGALITDGRAFEVREYTAEGELRRILRVDRPGLRVTPEMVASAQVTESLRGELPIPDTLPAFRSLRVDALGWLWAELYDWDAAKPKRWIVFAPSGEARGVVRTPAGLEVAHIGEHFILGVYRDDLDVESVHQHALHRRNAEMLSVPR